MEETRKMTVEMKEAFRYGRKMAAYAEAVKSRTFVRTKTIADAIFAQDLAWSAFWEIVTKTWPDTAGKECSTGSDYSITIK